MRIGVIGLLIAAAAGLWLGSQAGGAPADTRYDGGYSLFDRVVESNTGAVPVGGRANYGGYRFNVANGVLSGTMTGAIVGEQLTNGVLTLADGAGQLGGSGRCTVSGSFKLNADTTVTFTGSADCTLSLFPQVRLKLSLDGRRGPAATPPPATTTQGTTPTVTTPTITRPNITTPTITRPVNPTKKLAFGPRHPPDARVGRAYPAFSFCRPAAARGRLCDNRASKAIDPSGGVPPYTFRLAVGMGHLPKGLVLNTNTGVIAGTPEPGTDRVGRPSGHYRFVVCAYDHAGGSHCAPVELHVLSR